MGRPLKDAALVRVHHGSGCVQARVTFLECKALEAGEQALAQLRCESPIFVFAGDQFIVRDWAEQCTLAGGLVLDPQASRRFLRTEARRAFLCERAGAPEQVSAFIRSELRRKGAQRRETVLIQSRFSREEIFAECDALVKNGEATLLGDWICRSDWWQALRQKAAGAIDAEHRAFPQKQGLALSQLRDFLESELPEIFDLLIADLCRTGFVQTGKTIRRLSHRPALPPSLEATGTRLRAALSAKPFEPPSRKELAPDAATQQALRFLLESGEATELSPDVIVLTESLSRMREIAREFLRQRGKGTVSEIRQAIGASRRIVVPLLERLDREGVTRREGDYRVLKEKV